MSLFVWRTKQFRSNARQKRDREFATAPAQSCTTGVPHPPLISRESCEFSFKRLHRRRGGAPAGVCHAKAPFVPNLHFRERKVTGRYGALNCSGYVPSVTWVFGCNVPDKLAIESVVAVSIADGRNRKEFEDKLRAFKRENSLSVGNDTINLHIAHYRKDPLTVEMLEV